MSRFGDRSYRTGDRGVLSASRIGGDSIFDLAIEDRIKGLCGLNSFEMVTRTSHIVILHRTQRFGLPLGFIIIL